jgi:hypothetical protein
LRGQPAQNRIDRTRLYTGAIDDRAPASVRREELFHVLPQSLIVPAGSTQESAAIITRKLDRACEQIFFFIEQGFTHSCAISAGKGSRD